MSNNGLAKVYSILEKIEYIETIIENSGNITYALEDITTARAAIFMHLVAIAEQFNKLKQKNQNEILNFFEPEELKGIYDIRVHIAHDYDGVNLAIIEWVLRYGLPQIKKKCLKIIEKYAKQT